MKNAIGGYFPLELPLYEEYHKDAIKLNTGRNCLEYILLSRQYKKVYIPFYTCDVVLEPFQKTGTEYAFYHINLDFELAEDIDLRDGEALLYTNYYGLKQRYVETLAGLYGKQLIVDDTQAFYAKPISGIDTFYTCRKFFGVPDGAYLYTEKRLEMFFEQDVSYTRTSHLLKRIDLSAEEGFSDFHKAGDALCNQPIRNMSKLTERIMQSINYNEAVQRIRENFCQLHESLSANNLLNLTLDDEAVPMVYPYLTNKEGLREHLIRNRIFVACYWQNVIEWSEREDVEKYIANHLLPLPIDQRYNYTQMNNIIGLIKI